MQRNSLQDQDGVTWQPAALPLGSGGLDLRNPTTPGALTKLLNARFRDEQTLDRRNGYRGVVLQDGGEFAPGVNEVPAYDDDTDLAGWDYGHGQQIVGFADTHYPIARRGRGTFRHDDTDLAWTGDRLLILGTEGPCLGHSPFWRRGSSTTPLAHGIPAYLPVQSDSTPPDVITGDYVETCLTTTSRVIVATSSSGDLIAWVVDRTTGTLLNRTVLYNGTIYDPRVVRSTNTTQEYPMVFWRVGTDLYSSYWSGTGWSIASPIASACDAHEVVECFVGCMLLWRTAGTVKIGTYIGHSTYSGSYDFGTTVPISSTGALALAVSDFGPIAVVYEAASGQHLWLSTFSSTMGSQEEVELVADHGPWNSGLTACWRKLSDTSDLPVVVHAGLGDSYTKILEAQVVNGTLTVLQTETRYNTHVASKSFLVGDEVFCWLRATNSETNYLVGGVTGCQVSGIADREEAKERVVNNGVKSIPIVAQDPADQYRFTWIRPYTTFRVLVVDGQDTSTTYGGSGPKFEDLYDRAGNARIGDLNFLPKLSAVQYGEAVYLAGSHVRCWDGYELGDAGFHDYPLVSSTSHSNSTGSLTNAGTYYYRVYPVRYNKRGERFQGPAITSSLVTLGATSDTVELTIKTVPCTNHDDVQFEIYRTESGQTTFYLVGATSNDLTAATVTYIDTLSDAVLVTHAADPHAPGIGLNAEVEELGPIGCELLMAAGDRLWGAGGQLPPGTVQYSKLHENGEGVGFDALASTQQIDLQGKPITSMSSFGDIVVFFLDYGMQVLTNSGPNNYGAGGFGVPQLVLADGATTHWGTAITPIGIVFWGADGPRLLAANMQVDQICAPVRELTKELSPSGVQVDLSRQECVWYTEEGTAVLWNFRAVESKFGQLTSMGRWAQWSGLRVAGCSSHALVTVDGRALYEDEDAYGDDGVPFAYTGRTGIVSPESILGGYSMVRAVGVAGEYLGDHTLRVKVWYNAAPLWTDQWEWQPGEEMGLTPGTELADLTAAEIDALDLRDRSGAYATHKRTSRQVCRSFQVEWSDISSLRPTYRLHELTFELGGHGGLGRVPVHTISTSVGR